MTGRVWNVERSTEENRRSYLRNRDIRLEKQKRYQENHKEDRKQYLRKWHDRNPTYDTDYVRGRCQSDPAFMVLKRCRSRLKDAIRSAGTDQCDRTVKLLGCTPRELRKHLEKHFSPGMTWQNRHLWHIDHIRPCADFELTNPEQQRDCFHYSNLQPLWIEDHKQKTKEQRNRN